MDRASIKGNTNMSFANLKRQKGNGFDSLRNKMKDEAAGAKSFKDDRFWKLTVDKSGNGYAVIRFLSAPEGEELPYALRYEHAFQDKNTKKWYINNCHTTLGQGNPCPVCDANSELWNTGTEANQALVRERKRGKRYYANILVINDSAHPENNGKVFLYQFGPKIYQKILDKIDPQFPDEKPCDVFDFWGGANFRLKAHTVNNQRSYDKSDFDSPSELLNGDDTALEEVYNSLHSLKELIAPEAFKSYADAQKQLNAVLGVRVNSQSDNSFISGESSAPTNSFSQSASKAVEEDAPFDSGSSNSNSDSDDLAAYQALLNG